MNSCWKAYTDYGSIILAIYLWIKRTKKKERFSSMFERFHSHFNPAFYIKFPKDTLEYTGKRRALNESITRHLLSTLHEDGVYIFLHSLLNDYAYYPAHAVANSSS